MPPPATSTALLPPARAAQINRMLSSGKMPSLDPDALIAKARAQTGLHDLGPEAVWRRSLELLMQSLHRQASLNALGTIIAHGQMVALLANRLRLHALWRRRPEILEWPVRAPVVVLGQMRSGSTRMQRLLACDPQLNHTRFFESWNPVPVAPRLGPVDDRRLRSRFALLCARAVNPHFGAIHPTSVAAPDEEIGWHSISLYGSAFEAQWRVPDFGRHCEALDPTAIYREFKAMLQTVAWLRRADPDRPWILKVPQFVQDLPALLHIFPDARLVCLHRPTEAVVASSASLACNQMRVQSDAVDPHWVGREWLRKTVLRARRLDSARAAARQLQVDVYYAMMDADWRGEMARVYAALGLHLTPAALNRMERYTDAAARDRGGKHRYALADFGLTAAQLRAAFAEPELSRAA